MIKLDKVNIISSIILILIASIAYYPVVMAYADEFKDKTETIDQVTLEVTKTEVEEESTEKTGIKLEHKVGVTGNFEGTFDLTMINTTGKYNLASEVDSFVLVGTFEETGVSHYDPYTGKYVISNPNCSHVSADLVLQSKETKINLEFNGKNCHYGLISYVVGTFEATDSTGKYDIESGDGRITFVADHHNNNVSGQLKGSFE